jgi:hypothetical protein
MNFPKELNVHYGKQIKIIGGVDLNPDKHVTEYNKRYLDRSPENQQKNPSVYLNALARRKYQKYIQMVHGPNSCFDRSIPIIKSDKCKKNPEYISVQEISLKNPRDQQHLS